MDRHRVDSSNIVSVGWEDGVLEVEFTKGEVYQYQGVPEHLYMDLLHARSVGKKFAAEIVGHFEGERV
jgi:KTSC domain